MSIKNTAKLDIRSVILKGASVGVAVALMLCFATGCSKTDPEDIEEPAPDVNISITEDTPDVNATDPENTPDAITTAPENTPTPENTDQPTQDEQPIGDSGLDSTDLSALITALPNNDALVELHSIFTGYWITNESSFVGFIYIDSAPGIEYGLFQTSYMISGRITDARAMNDREAELTIFIPGTPATEMDDATPDRTETINIDISNYNDNRLNIKVINLDGGEWRTYEFGGGSWEDLARN